MGGHWSGGKSRIVVYCRSSSETMDLNVTASLMQTPEEYYGSGGNELWAQRVPLVAQDNTGVREGIRAAASGQRPMPSKH